MHVNGNAFYVENKNDFFIEIEKKTGNTSIFLIHSHFFQFSCFSQEKKKKKSRTCNIAKQLSNDDRDEGRLVVQLYTIYMRLKYFRIRFVTGRNRKSFLLRVNT